MAEHDRTVFTLFKPASDGSRGKKYYVYVETCVNQTSAKSLCRDDHRGGSLASYRSRDEAEAVKEILS